jgi:HlyD family secretion protein
MNELSLAGPRSLLRFSSVMLIVALLSACGSDDEIAAPPTETLKAQAFVDVLYAQGELKSAETTPLNVPGANFEQRQLVFMVTDGTRVEKDQLIARFQADASQKDLSQQELELARNTLRLASERAQANTNAAQIQTERSDILGQLGLSERYAELDPNSTWVSKNELLDKLQDLGLLQNKRGTADWRIDHQKKRAEAGSEVTLAQRESVQALVNRNRQSLQDLELRAPHAGVFRLNTNWDGSKIAVGASAWAGDDFASLPDLNKLVARFSVPQNESSGLQVGQRVEIRLAGTGALIKGQVSRVGASASVRSRESPVKYLEFDASFDLAATQQWQLAPGMAISGTVYRVEATDVLSVPNTALKLAPLAIEAAANVANAPRTIVMGAGGKPDRAAIQAMRAARAQAGTEPAKPEVAIERDAVVWMADGSERKIKVGAQGNARSIVLSGLQNGDAIRILRPEASAENAGEEAIEKSNGSRDKT